MSNDEQFERQKRTYEQITETLMHVEQAVLAREGIKKVVMVVVLSAMSVAFSKFIGAYWQIDSPTLLIFPTVLFNFSLYSLYDKFVQRESLPVYIKIASSFLKNNPNFSKNYGGKYDFNKDE